MWWNYCRTKIKTIWFDTKYFLIRFLFFFLPIFFKKIGNQPISNDIKSKNLGICAVLGHTYVDMAIYSFYSFFFQTKKILPIYIIDDGTLTENDSKKLFDFFSSIQIERRSVADEKMNNLLKNFKNFHEHRFVSEGNYKLKFDAFFLNPFKSFIFMDADILFVNTTQDIDKWIKKPNNMFYTHHIEKTFEDNYFPEFSLRKLIYTHLKISMTAGFSSGFLTISDKSNLSLDAFESIFSFYKKISYVLNQTLEENAFSIYYAKSGKSLDPYEYNVFSFFSEIDYLKNNDKKASMLHFGHETKRKFFSEAVKFVIKTRGFRKYVVTH